MRSLITQQCYDNWSKSYKLSTQFLFNPTTIKLGPSTKGPFLNITGHSNELTTRMTRATTNHAPTGEFQRRFHPHKKSICTECNVLQSRAHILNSCTKYTRNHLTPPQQHTELSAPAQPTPFHSGLIRASPHPQDIPHHKQRCLHLQRRSGDIDHAPTPQPAKLHCRPRFRNYTLCAALTGNRSTIHCNVSHTGAPDLCRHDIK